MLVASEYHAVICGRRSYRPHIVTMLPQQLWMFRQFSTYRHTLRQRATACEQNQQRKQKFQYEGTSRTEFCNLLTNMLLALFWDNHSHIETTAFKGKTVVSVIYAQTATNALGRFIHQMSSNRNLFLYRQRRLQSISSHLDVCLRGILTQLAFFLTVTGTMQTVARLRINFLQTQFLLFCETAQTTVEISV